MRPIILTMAAACSLGVLVCLSRFVHGAARVSVHELLHDSQGRGHRRSSSADVHRFTLRMRAYRIDGNTWDVWVFDVGTTEPASIPTPDDATSTGGGSFTTAIRSTWPSRMVVWRIGAGAKRHAL